MVTKNIRLLLSLVLVTFLVAPLNAQECQENFNKGENCRKNGKYEKAIGYYTKAQNCGDVNYRTKSAAMINDVNRLIRERDAVRNTPSSKRTEYIIVPSLIYLPHGTEEQTITVESSGNWGVKGRSNIINVAKKNAKTLTVSSISENTSTKPRRSSVVVECGEATKIITIEQDGIPEVLEYKSKYMNVPYTGGKFIVELNTNTKWKVDYADWYKVTPDENDSTRMVIIVDSNTKNEDRDGTIIVRSEGGTAYDEMEIHQYANESKISFDSEKNGYQIKAEGDTIDVKVISDNPKWTPSDHPSWCSLEYMNDSTLKVVVLPNETYYSRQGFINIKSNDRVVGVWIGQDASEMPDIFAKKVLGGRNVSFGLTAGYVMPFVNSSSSGTYTGSVINYSLGDSNEDVNYSSQTGFKIGAVVDLRVYKNWYVKTGIDYTHLQYTNSFNADVDRSVNQGFNVVYQGVFQNTFKEKYKFDFISIPVLASYRFVFDKSNNLQLDLGPVINFALSGKMSFEGNSNSDNVYPHSVIYGDAGPIIGNRSSEYMRYTGEMDLFDTKVTNTTTSSDGGMSRDFLNEYTATAAPYNRVSLGLRLGVTYEYAGLQLGLAYTQMLTNMANSSFWNSGRLPIFGQTSDVLMAGYKHRINTLELKVGYIFRYKK